MLPNLSINLHSRLENNLPRKVSKFIIPCIFNKEGGQKLKYQLLIYSKILLVGIIYEYTKFGI